MRLPFLLLICWLGSLAGSLQAQVEISGTAKVRDGDTLDMEGVRIRLFGVDAPESQQQCTKPDGSAWACGTAARNALAARAEGKRLICLRQDVDNYGRIVAVCRLGSEDLNGWLVASGWAVAYRQFSQEYVDEEVAARAARLNIWNGSFQMPEEYRRSQSTAATGTASNRPNCNIKGNISSSGDRIYHVPGGEFYQQTQINTAFGERLFCSEQEARDAGWRKSRR